MLRSRRSVLGDLMGLAACVPLWQFEALGQSGPSSHLSAVRPQGQQAHRLSAADDSLLDQMQKRAFQFFWEQSDPSTGLTKDRNLANSVDDPRDIASIAATGFGLTTLAIADKRRWMNSAQLVERVRNTLRFLTNSAFQQHGFLYHFMHMRTGERAFNCEISTIDTSLLLCGVLTCRAHFDDPELRSLATQFYERVDWPWFRNGGTTLSMGWKPESGFLDARWDHYCELMMIYLLGLGSPTHPLPAQTWDAWTRPTTEYRGFQYISAHDPLFVHQYSHAWFDFRGKRDGYANYFLNSIRATHAHKLFCLPFEAIPRLHKPTLGYQRVGFCARLHGLGWAAAFGTNRWFGGSVRRRRFSRISAPGHPARPTYHA